jgi:HKD family nuclease
MEPNEFVPRTLFFKGKGDAHVIGLPPNFDLPTQLLKAESICLATAFARMSGWELIEKSVLASGASLRLLAGRDFHLTQPQLLRRWLELVKPSRIQARLFSLPEITFHAKVLIASVRPTQDFAIIGSGNLTKGGLIDNAECSIYIDNPSHLRELNRWFTRTFKQADRITEALIRDYEEEYDAVQMHIRQGQKALQMVRKQIELKNAVTARTNFFLVNTNLRNSEEDHNRMIENREASAFNHPWKFMIDDIHENDIVFLYKSREGVVAFGRAGKLEIRDDEDSHSVPLDHFHLVQPPVAASKIRELAGWSPKGWRLRNTVESLEWQLGKDIYEAALTPHV